MDDVIDITPDVEENKPKKDPISMQNKSILFGLAVLVVFIVVAIVLVFSFQSIDKEGIKCVQDPILWANNYLITTHQSEMSCSCGLGMNVVSKRVDEDINWSIT